MTTNKTQTKKAAPPLAACLAILSSCNPRHTQTGANLRSYLSSKGVDERFKAEMADAVMGAAVVHDDLLAALKSLANRFTVPCRFTITKVASDCYTCGKTSDGMGGTRICDECAKVLNARAAIARAEGKGA